MAKPKFKGSEIVQRTGLPYGLVRGEVADAVAADYLRVLKEKGFGNANFALKDALRIVKVSGESFLSYTTPEAMMVLANFVSTKDYGFTPVTPQQTADIYNTNPDFINDNFWLESQLIANPWADLSKNENVNPSFVLLNEQLRNLTGNRDKCIAVPYSAVVPAILSNGHLGDVSGYKLTENAKGLVKVLDWTKEQVRGFKFNKFDENTGVPVPAINGVRSFIGLTDKLFSAFYVYRYLYANGYRLFVDTNNGSRVVGWSFGEADAKK